VDGRGRQRFARTRADTAAEPETALVVDDRHRDGSSCCRPIASAPGTNSRRFPASSVPAMVSVVRPTSTSHSTEPRGTATASWYWTVASTTNRRPATAAPRAVGATTWISVCTRTAGGELERGRRVHDAPALVRHPAAAAGRVAVCSRIEAMSEFFSSGRAAQTRAAIPATSEQRTTSLRCTRIGPMSEGP